MNNHGTLCNCKKCRIEYQQKNIIKFTNNNMSYDALIDNSFIGTSNLYNLVNPYNISNNPYIFSFYNAVMNNKLVIKTVQQDNNNIADNMIVKMAALNNASIDASINASTDSTIDSNNDSTNQMKSNDKSNDKPINKSIKKSNDKSYDKSYDKPYDKDKKKKKHGGNKINHSKIVFNNNNRITINDNGVIIKNQITINEKHNRIKFSNITETTFSNTKIQSHGQGPNQIVQVGPKKLKTLEEQLGVSKQNGLEVQYNKNNVVFNNKKNIIDNISIKNKTKNKNKIVSKDIKIKQSNKSTNHFERTYDIFDDNLSDNNFVKNNKKCGCGDKNCQI